MHSLLEERGCLALLEDGQLATATQTVAPEAGTTRAQLKRAIRSKEAAIELLPRRYSSKSLPAEVLQSLTLWREIANDLFRL